MNRKEEFTQLAKKQHLKAKQMFFVMYTINKIRHDYAYQVISKELGYSLFHLKRIVPLNLMKAKDKKYQEKEKARKKPS